MTSEQVRSIRSNTELESNRVHLSPPSHKSIFNWPDEYVNASNLCDYTEMSCMQDLNHTSSSLTRHVPEHEITRIKNWKPTPLQLFLSKIAVGFVHRCLAAVPNTDRSPFGKTLVPDGWSHSVLLLGCTPRNQRAPTNSFRWMTRYGAKLQVPAALATSDKEWNWQTEGRSN